MSRFSSRREPVHVPLPRPVAPGDVAFRHWAPLHAAATAWPVLAIGATASALVAFLVRDGALTCLASGALLLATWRSWLPVRYHLGLSGVTETVLGIRRRIPWIAIARYDLQRDGVWLYAQRGPTSARGIFLPLGAERDAAVATIEYYLGTWTATGDTSTLAHAPSLPTPLQH
jgi:hypothetical protein